MICENYVHINGFNWGHGLGDSAEEGVWGYINYTKNNFGKLHGNQ